MDIETTCHHCDAPATRLCDFVLGFATDKDVITLDDEKITCSRPLCDECAREIGWVHFRNHGFDSIDRCRDHAERKEWPKPRPLREILTEKRRLQLRARP